MEQLITSIVPLQGPCVKETMPQDKWIVSGRLVLSPQDLQICCLLPLIKISELPHNSLLQ